MALGAPVLLAINIWACTATIDFAKVDAWRRMWNDLDVATASWVDAIQGPTPVKVTGLESDAVARTSWKRNDAQSC